MDSDLSEYYDMLWKTESVTAYVCQMVPRKAAQELGREASDKKDYRPKPDCSIHKCTLGEECAICLEQGPSGADK